VLDAAIGDCTAPMATTSCSLPATPAPAGTTYFNEAGTCDIVDADDLHPYDPPPRDPGGPCFISAGIDFSFELGGIPIPLEDLQFAANYVGSPATGLVEGVMRGFMAEADADLVLLPDTLPLVGGSTLSSLLAGGIGACAGHDDRDLGPDETTLGWWFYFSFVADEVTFTGS
jgi:hypothetical protein